MLLTWKTVEIPAAAERDADLGEYGHLSLATRAQFGRAACEGGNPDHEVSDAFVTAVDTVANILHFAAEEGLEVESVISSARRHFEEERAAA